MCLYVSYMYMALTRPVYRMTVMIAVIAVIAVITAMTTKSHRDSAEGFSSSGVTPEAHHMLSKENRALLLNALQQTHKIFTDNHIFYCMEGGTLLGAIRHKGLIPWDDDADLMVWKVDQARIMSLRPIFNSVGLELTERDHERVMRIYCKTGSKFPFIDLFLYTMPVRDDDNMYRCLPYKKNQYDQSVITCSTQTVQKEACCYPRRERKDFAWWWTHQNRGKDLFPLKLYKFEHFELQGPHDPEPYLTTWYGKDYMTNFKVTHSHAPL